MTTKLAAIVINVVDLEKVADFWKAFLDVGERHRVPGFVWLERQPGAGVSLAFQHVEQPTEGRNRLHLDFGSSDAAADAARVVELGGRQLEQHEIGGFEWTVFVAQADPDDHA
jgi:hypothetical protein